MFKWLIIATALNIMLVNGSPSSSLTRQLRLQHGSRAIESVRFTQDGRRLVSASVDGTVVVWDTRSGKSLWRADLGDQTKPTGGSTIAQIMGMDLAPDDKTIAVSFSRSVVLGDRLQGKDEYLIGILDANTGREIEVLSGHTDLIGQIAFSPNGQQLLSESGDHTARLWDLSTRTQLLVTKLYERGAAVAFSPSGQLFAVATQPVYGLPPKPIVRVYDSATGEAVREFPRRTNVVTSIAFSSDDQTLAIAGGNASGSLIDVWGSSGQEPKTTFPANGREINVIAFSKDGHLLASGGYGNGQGFVEVNGLEANGLIRSFKVGGDVMSLDFSSDGTKLVVGSDKGEVTVLTLQGR